MLTMSPPTSPNPQWGDAMPRWMIAALVVCVAVVIAAYFYGIPMFGRLVADRIPASVVERLDSATLSALDQQVFTPSTLPRERQDAIANAFGALMKTRDADTP